AGAASTLGAAVAGLGAGALIPHVGLSAIPVLAGVLVLVVLGLCVAQDRAFAAGGAPRLDAAPAAGPRPAARAARAPAGLASLQRALVAAMLAVAVLESVVMTVIDLQFIASVKARYTGDDVAVVLALFYGGMNAVLLVLQGAAVPH